MRINVLKLGTQGVDMKTNPLLLGNNKLHSATNLVFEEGVIRTRPGFRYHKTPASGQFQGAAEFRPRQGISSSRFSDLFGGVVFVADGDVWAGCAKVGTGFSCAGDVHLFQAENYLIFQCKETDTFWWDGAGGLVRSPGMNEQDWNDPETPVQELATETPIADIPDCDLPGYQKGVKVTFLVVDATTEAPIETVVWEMRHNDNLAFNGLGDDNGNFVFFPEPRVYKYTIRKVGYLPLEDIELVVNGVGEAYHFEECYPPVEVIKGNIFVTARMTPQEEVCDLVMTDFVVGPENTQFVFTAVNNGNVALTVSDLVVTTEVTEEEGSGGAITTPSFVPALPVTLLPGIEVVFSVSTSSSVVGGTIEAVTNCESFIETIPDIVAPICAFEVSSIDVSSDELTPDPNVLDDWNLGQFVVTNTGNIPMSVTVYSGAVGVLQSPSLPAEILPGNAVTFNVGGFDTIPNTTFHLETTCGESAEFTYPFPPGFIPPP